jgi:hypothetical protein
MIMKKATQTVWTDDKGNELLVKKGAVDYFIPLSTISKEKLAELALAVNDALAQDPHHA